MPWAMQEAWNWDSYLWNLVQSNSPPELHSQVLTRKEGSLKFISGPFILSRIKRCKNCLHPDCQDFLFLVANFFPLLNHDTLSSCHTIPLRVFYICLLFVLYTSHQYCLFFGRSCVVHVQFFSRGLTIVSMLFINYVLIIYYYFYLFISLINLFTVSFSFIARYKKQIQ